MLLRGRRCVRASVTARRIHACVRVGARVGARVGVAVQKRAHGARTSAQRSSASKRRLTERGDDAKRCCLGVHVLRCIVSSRRVSTQRVRGYGCASESVSEREKESLDKERRLYVLVVATTTTTTMTTMTMVRRYIDALLR